MVSLDIGCGYKRDHKKRGQIGIDINKGLCDIQADAQNLPFRKDIFNYVYMYSVLEHLPHPLQALREAKRVTKKNAKIEIIIPKIASHEKWNLRRIVLEFPFGVITAVVMQLRREKLSGEKALSHQTHITPSDIKKIFPNISVLKTGKHAWWQGKKGETLTKVLNGFIMPSPHLTKIFAKKEA